ncbi:MAG: KUP/HAK/KT family potassium transporter, partial [Devosia sp.]
MANVNNAAASAAQSHHSDAKNKALPGLVIGAIGVVYGDIGTSPLYAFRQALATRPAEQETAIEILGLLSLIVWAITITVTVKYIFFVTRADNKGEGGTLSLMSLAQTAFVKKPVWILGMGIAGAALFFGDAIITPAISVLSAVEGVSLVAPNLTTWVVPITVVLIIALFMVQRFGTHRVSRVFGPITVVWFITLGVGGLLQVIHNPGVLLAVNPAYGVTFLLTHLDIALVVIGAIFLAVTGVEGLYVDLGHFGRKPIVIAWFSLVFPALLLNYFGQGAYVLSVGPTNVTYPFYEMWVDWMRLPMVIFATAATIIASQAVITGAYSLAQQAIALNLLPRMTVLHTSETQSGQIYVPQVNGTLMILVILLVVGFQ